MNPVCYENSVQQKFYVLHVYCSPYSLSLSFNRNREFLLYIFIAVMELSSGAAGYRLGTPPMLLAAALKAGLDVS